MVYLEEIEYSSVQHILYWALYDPRSLTYSPLGSNRSP